jgi:hypothetical protein
VSVHPEYEWSQLRHGKKSIHKNSDVLGFDAVSLGTTYFYPVYFFPEGEWQ